MRLYLLPLAFLYPLSVSAQEMRHPAVNKSIDSFQIIEPWETPYMLFMHPGLIIWIIGAVWCFRKNNIRGSILLQVLGALEIMIGGVIAYIVAIKDVAYPVSKSGEFDPAIVSYDVNRYAVIPLIGLIAHFILLAITLVIAIRAKRKLKG